jgi:hypothetical protein
MSFVLFLVLIRFPVVFSSLASSVKSTLESAKKELLSAKDELLAEKDVLIERSGTS